MNNKLLNYFLEVIIMIENETISLEDYITMVRKWYLYKHEIDNDVLIFNIKNYYNLAYGFMIKKFTDIAELSVISSPGKCISIMSFVCLLSDDMFLTYNFVDDNGEKEIIDNIIWVDKNEDLPEKRIENGSIVISFELILNFVTEMWDDLYSTTQELSKLQKICIDHSKLMDMVRFDEFQKDAIQEMFYTTEVHFGMKYMSLK